MTVLVTVFVCQLATFEFVFRFQKQSFLSRFLRMQMCYPVAKTCGKGEKRSGMRFVTYSSKLMPLNHLGAT